MFFRVHLSRVAQLIAINVGFLLLGISTAAQGTSDYLPGKNYVLRISPYFEDREDLVDRFMPVLIAELDGSPKMFEHIKKQLLTLSTATDQKWFLGYYDPTRQTKNDLMLDFDLLTWFFHGKDVQLLPIETVQSPMSPLLIPRVDR